MARLMETPHLDDSDLLRLLDEEGSTWERGRCRAHLEACGSCAARFEVLSRRSIMVSARLSELDLPSDFVYPARPVRKSAAAPRHGSGRVLPRNSGLRAAVLIGLFLLPLVAVQPVRAAVVEWLSDRWAELAALLEGQPPEAPLSIPQVESGATLWFGSTAEILVVELDTFQAAGELVMRTVDGAEGSLEVVGDARGETPVLSERGVRIRNTRASTVRYEVGVPTGVERVQVRIGGASFVVLTRQEISSGRVIELQPPR